MGEMEVPADALYGASTQRAVLNFPISGQPLPRRFIRALALIKLAAAETNARAGPARRRRRRGDRGRRGRGRRRRPRRPVPDRRLPDRLRDLDEHEHERGRRPPRRRPAGRPSGPPERRRQPLPELERHDPDGAPAVGGDRDRGGAAAGARAAPGRARRPRRRSSGRSSRPAGRTSRTRPRSGSARSSAATPARSRSRIRRARAAQAELLDVPLGGTAVGTGINAHPEYAARACARLSALTGLEVRETPNHFHAQATLDAAIAAHGAIRTIALQPVEDRLGRPADGDGPAGRDRASSPCRRPSPARASCRAR